MRRSAGTRGRISAGTVAARLCAVLAVCVGLRAVLDAAEGAPKAGPIPDSLGLTALAVTLPGAGDSLPGTGDGLPDAGDGLPDTGGGLPGTGELTLSVTLPGWGPADQDPADQDPAGTRRPDRSGGRLLSPAPEAGEADPPPDAADPDPDPIPDASEPKPQTPAPEEPPSDEDPAQEPPETHASDAPPQNDAIGTTITGAGSGYQNGGEGIYLKNRTKYDIDVSKYIDLPLEFSASDGAAVLIVHTHGSEAYNPAGDDIYVPSDPSRTEDRTYNVVRVGDELARVLEARGIRVIHDRELYDYPTYTGSYDRSLASIKRHLEETPEIKVVIDLHRDALEGDGKLYKTVADVGDEPCAQVMLICGSNSSGLNHPDWEKNLTFALKIQREMAADYPTLARPLKISEYRYNQHATHGSLIAEVGTNGNTLQEALNAVRYFGECLADVLTE